MERRTQGVHDLVTEILQQVPSPYNEDIIEDVFLAIENSQQWMNRYRELEADLGHDVTNNWIGRHTKDITGMNTVREVSAKRSRLIKDYTKLSH